MSTATPEHPGTTMIAVRVPDEFATQLRQAAEAEERTTSNYVRRVLRAQMARLAPAQQ
jgi:hypothetical protein